jgi:hypothetical protein
LISQSRGLGDVYKRQSLNTTHIADMDCRRALSVTPVWMHYAQRLIQPAGIGYISLL